MIKIYEIKWSELRNFVTLAELVESTEVCPNKTSVKTEIILDGLSTNYGSLRSFKKLDSTEIDICQAKTLNFDKLKNRRN